MVGSKVTWVDVKVLLMSETQDQDERCCVAICLPVNCPSHNGLADDTCVTAQTVEVLAGVKCRRGVVAYTWQGIWCPGVAGLIPPAGDCFNYVWEG